MLQPEGITNVKKDPQSVIDALKARVEEVELELEYERTLNEIRKLKRRLKKLDKKLYG